jgi:hypothetical protein
MTLMTRRSLVLAFATMCTGLLLTVAPSGLAEPAGQVVFTNAVHGQAGSGIGAFTYGGVTNDQTMVGFSIHCSLATEECIGSLYFAPFALGGTGNALTIHVSGTLSESDGTYTITITSPTSPEAVSGCTLTNRGTAPGATQTQTVDVVCTGNGTTTLSGSSTATGIVNVTGP